MSKRILLVDDESSLRDTLAELLELEDFLVKTAGNGIEALDILKESEIDFVLSDIRMPGMDGVELLEKIKENNPDLPIVALMSGFSEYSKQDVIDKGACHMFSKPFSIDELLELIEKT